MNKKELIEKLVALQVNYDTEEAHVEADELLMDFLSNLGYDDVVKEYDKIEKWYA